MKRAGAERVQGEDAMRDAKRARLAWSEVARNPRWVAEVHSIRMQWRVCNVHEKRCQYESCIQCKRARDTAQVVWEEMHPAKVSKTIGKRPVIVVHPLTKRFMGKYNIADQGIT